jgi:hypothetical protein
LEESREKNIEDAKRVDNQWLREGKERKRKEVANRDA